MLRPWSKIKTSPVLRESEEIGTEVTVKVLPIDLIWKSCGLYSTGLTMLKPLSTPPFMVTKFLK